MVNRLKFNKSGKFKIVQFTDVHWQDGGETDQKTADLMQQILTAENPDFVVFTGDTVYGEKNKEQFLKAIAPVDKAKIPWAAVYGNHDTEWGVDKSTLNLEQKKSAFCLTELDASSEGKDYYLILEGQDGKPNWIMYFMDSGFLNTNEIIGGYDYLKRNQIDWYVRHSIDMQNQYGDIPALMFFHIPLPEYNEVWDYCVCYGQKNESVCCAKQNSGMFSAMLERGDVKGVFVGHDHINDYYGELYGIRLCYGKATGYNTYSQDGFEHGARVIEIDEKRNDFITWVRTDKKEKTRQAKHEPEKIREDI